MKLTSQIQKTENFKKLIMYRISFLPLLFVLIGLSGCLFENPKPPTIYAEVISIEANLVNIRVTVTIERNSEIFQSGVCYSPQPNPTLEEPHNDEYDNKNSFTVSLYGTRGEKLYVRPYCANGAGIVYGNELEIDFPIDDSGTAWVQVVLPNIYYLNKVIWANSQFVTVGNNGSIFISPDGWTWNNSSLSNAPSLYGVTWSGSKYVAVGNSAIYSSTDGITWTSRFTYAGNDFAYPRFYAVAWSGTRFVAVGYRLTNIYETCMYTSEDGITWTPIDFVLTRGELWNVTWANNQFMAIGTLTVDSNGGYTSETLVLTSTDGLTWNQNTYPDMGTPYDVLWNGEKYIMIANSTPYEVSGPAFGNSTLLSTSSNGLTWSTTTISKDSFFSLTFTGKTYVATGRGIYTSKDLVSWSTQLNAPIDRFTSTAWSGKCYAGVAAPGLFIYRSDY